MSGFVASPTPPVTPPDTEIEAGGFWPAVDVNRFRDAMRIGGQAIPDARVREALIGAVIICDDNLTLWRAQQEVEGRADLAAVPASTVGGESHKVILWRRAVHAMAAADLIETHPDVTATATGLKQADSQALTADDHRRNAIHAIRTITGVTRTTVELI